MLLTYLTPASADFGENEITQNLRLREVMNTLMKLESRCCIIKIQSDVYDIKGSVIKLTYEDILSNEF